MKKKVVYRVYVAERNKDKVLGEYNFLKEVETHADATAFVAVSKEAEAKTGYYRIVAHTVKGN